MFDHCEIMSIFLILLLLSCMVIRMPYFEILYPLLNGRTADMKVTVQRVSFPNNHKGR